MVVIVAGSRGIENFKAVEAAIQDSGFEITQLISGGARGVDRLGEQYAREHNIPIKQFIPDWNGLGRAAGHIRNKQMAEYVKNNGGGGLVACWANNSRGTKSMIEYAKQCGLKVYIHYVY